MRHPPGQTTHGLHFLGLSQLFLKLFAMRDVLLDGDIVRDAVFGISDRGDGGPLPEQVSAFFAVMELTFPGRRPRRWFPTIGDTLRVMSRRI